MIAVSGSVANIKQHACIRSSELYMLDRTSRTDCALGYQYYSKISHFDILHFGLLSCFPVRLESNRYAVLSRTLSLLVRELILLEYSLVYPYSAVFVASINSNDTLEEALQIQLYQEYTKITSKKQEDFD